MIEYIYFVKCPDCDDEHFYIFDDAKSYAMSCMSQKPVITQVEVCRNDFGECTDSKDLGQIWSWEDTMADIPDEEPELTSFAKCDTIDCADYDAEFAAIDNSLDSIPDNFRKPIPAGMTIDALVEELEENEDTVECKWCEELFDKSECRYEVDLGWLCSSCEAAIKSRGETLTFRENNYWDFLDESTVIPIDAVANVVDKTDFEIWGVESTGKNTYKAVLIDRFKDVNLQGSVDNAQVVHDEMITRNGLFIFAFNKEGLPELYSWNAPLLRKLHGCEIVFDDSRYDIALDTHFNNKKSADLTESAADEETVDLDYSDLEVTVYGDQVSGGYWDPPEYAEMDMLADYTYTVPKDEVIEYIQDYVTDEEVCQLMGLASEAEIPTWVHPRNTEEFNKFKTFWDNFWDQHFDTIFEKYKVKILEWFKESAEEKAREKYAEYHIDDFYDYDDYDESLDTTSATLEEAYDSDLIVCPECGENSYDSKAGFCVSCGL